MTTTVADLFRGAFGSGADLTGTRLACICAGPAGLRAGPGDHAPVPPAPNQPEPDPSYLPFTVTIRGGTTP